ncbi:MAG: Uma2 family endonuclease [Planctomycetota bacterium]|nr:Uma2 family endonuclease [Planctomycetota bacterium]
MSNAFEKQPVSIHDYLEGELVSRKKHEFVDGAIYAMAGASTNHNRIATNATVEIGSQLRGKKCQVFNSDMKVRIRQIRSTRFYYPDLSVVCQSNEGQESFQDLPIVIVEVVSDSTRRVDEYEKREAYLSINSLLVYILMEQNAAKALVYRRTDDGFVREVYFGMDAVIPLKEIECSLSLTEVYTNVEFIPPTHEDE